MSLYIHSEENYSRLYRAKTGRWRSTQATLREIPKAILALQKAFEYLTTQHS